MRSSSSIACGVNENRMDQGFARFEKLYCALVTMAFLMVGKNTWESKLSLLWPQASLPARWKHI